MRLYVAIREGDWVATKYSPFGNRIARQMERAAAFDFSTSKDLSSRWLELDRSVLAHTCSLEVPDEWTIERLKKLALDSASKAGLAQTRSSGFFGEVSSVWLADSVTDKKFPTGITVAQSGLTDGDLIVLCIEHAPHADYMLMPAPNPEQILRNFEFLENRRQLGRMSAICGVLLYDQSHLELARYVREYFDELSALTGDYLRLFVMERPEDWATAKKYWKPRLEPEIYRSLAALRWLHWVPFDSHRAYDLARFLSIPVTKVPCLVLFNSLMDKDRLVFPLGDVPLIEFRRLLGRLADLVEGPPKSYRFGEALKGTATSGWYLTAAEDETGEERMDRLRAVYDTLLSTINPAEEADAPRHFEFNGFTVFYNTGGTGPMSDTFNFYAQTTFINRPVDTVIRDFQKQFGDVSESDKFAELLRLVLSSRQLSDQEREAAAAQVTTAAKVVHDGSGLQGVRSRLDQVQAIVSKAADIAGPALSIISAIASSL
jgi:hypothetical protein